MSSLSIFFEEDSGSPQSSKLPIVAVVFSWGTPLCGFAVAMRTAAYPVARRMEVEICRDFSFFFGFAV